jgi:lipopolysaccharide export system protein LptA
MAWFVLSFAAMLTNAPGDEAVRQRMSQSKTPWDMGCDQMVIFNKENRTLCRGHAYANRDDLKVRCDTFEAFRDDKGDVSRLICSDNVQIASKEGNSKSDKAEWMADSQTLVLSGNPVVIQGKNVIRGEVIVYDLQNQRLSIKRVRGKVGQQPSLPDPKK